MGEAIRLEKGDVTVEEISEACDDCVNRASHVVMIHFRSAGMSQEIGQFCRTCAKNVATRIRNGLPQ